MGYYIIGITSFSGNCGRPTTVRHFPKLGESHTGEEHAIQRFLLSAGAVEATQVQLLLRTEMQLKKFQYVTSTKRSILEKQTGRCIVVQSEKMWLHNRMLLCTALLIYFQCIIHVQEHKLQDILPAFSSWLFSQLIPTLCPRRYCNKSSLLSPATLQLIEEIGGKRSKPLWKQFLITDCIGGTLLITTEVFPVLHWIQTVIHPEKNVSSLVTNWILFVKPIFVSKSDTVWEPEYYEGRRLKFLSTAVKDPRNTVHT